MGPEAFTGHMHRKAGSQAGRQTDRPTGRRTCAHARAHTHTHTHGQTVSQDGGDAFSGSDPFGSAPLAKAEKGWVLGQFLLCLLRPTVHPC